MEYLQYFNVVGNTKRVYASFKPYYKWNTFNTSFVNRESIQLFVLNLIINGIPSIQL